MIKSFRIRLTGRVQNVGFRYFAVREAQKEGIKGFVRNEPDGAVYVEAEGEEEAVNRFLVNLKQGPSWGRVDRVNVTEQPIRNFKGFTVKY
ncbi:MAG: acylphosphatase [Bacteroidales bacterium]|nr:acylphosphatase [Bacteroidales bacterium]